MENYIDEFKQRWNKIETITLSALRKQISAHNVDVSLLERTLQKECEEWLYGDLASAMWYNKFKQADERKAKLFGDYVSGISLHKEQVPTPSNRWRYVVSLLTALLVFLLVPYAFGVRLFVRGVIAIASYMLVWAVSASKETKQVDAYTEEVVSRYHAQLKLHYDKLLRIISE